MEKRVSRAKFIWLGALGAASVPVVAACGGESESGGSGSGNGSGDSPEGTRASGDEDTGTTSGGEPIASVSEVEAGSATQFEDAGDPAVLVHLENGDFVAYSAICTHQRCTVEYRGERLTCPCHGSIFDPANGAAVVSGPASRPLPEVPIEVRGGEVYRAG